MKIRVKLFATLRTYEKKDQWLEVKDGVTPKDIVRLMDLPEDKISIIMINGRHANLDRVLHDSDVLSIFPPVGGG